MEDEVLEIEEKEANLEQEETDEMAKNEENQPEMLGLQTPEILIDNEAQNQEKQTLCQEKSDENEKTEDKSEEISNLKAQLEEERRKRIESENKMLCMAILEEKGLPRSLCDFLVSSNEEETRKRADNVAEIIKKAVNDEVSKRLSTLPKPQKSKETLTKSAFKGMSLDEMQRLYKSDKTLYLELAKK